MQVEIPTLSVIPPAATLMPWWVWVVLSLMSLVVTFIGGGVFRTWLDFKTKKRAQTDEVALGMSDRYGDRITVLEREMKMEREKCDAELRVLRHQSNNMTMLFDGLLMLMEAAPDKAQEHIKKLKERRAQLEQNIAIEKAEISGAKIVAASASITEGEAA